MHMRKNAAFDRGSCAATVNVLKRECDITEAWRDYQLIIGFCTAQGQGSLWLFLMGGNQKIMAI